MDSRFKRQALRQLDDKLAQLAPLRSTGRPRDGWLAAIRQTLGINRRQMAERLGVAPSRVAQMEKNEVSGTSTLNSLERAADALDCELVYALIPRSSLKNTLERQARKVAKERASYVNHHMTLEAQGLDKETLQQYMDDDVNELLHDMPRWLWDERP